MGKTQKKNSKGRLDRFYFLAKEKGYRARSSFKIIQINEKYGHFLEKSKVVIDLCAAPGSWCQVASNLCPINSLIIGVDIVPIKPLPNCITFQSDITTEDCRSKLRGHLKTWKADTVLHDGAPNVGLGWVQDAFTQSQLVLKALKLAAENLAPGGTFVTKVFRSKDYNNLMWVLQQLFEKVEATKPPASRNVSAEIFVVCKGFKAPKKLDPRLLDPKSVFEEITPSSSNHEAKVFNPEKKTRKRDGYEEGDYLLYKELPLLDFIKDEEPIKILGSVNKLTEPEKEDKDWKMLKKLRHCTPEMRECLNDLKILGKKDFKLILKFRKESRKFLGLDDSDDTEIEPVVEELDEDAMINKELEELTERQKQKRKREKRNANELKQKEIRRMQMSMLTDMTIGIEASNADSKALFNLKSAESSGQLKDLARGKRSFVPAENSSQMDVSVAQEQDSDDEDLALDAELDNMYERYKSAIADKDSKYRAKLARGSKNTSWDGFEDGEDNVTEDFEGEEGSMSDSDEDLQDSSPSTSNSKDTLSKEAASFFALNPIFRSLDDSELITVSNTILDKRRNPSDQDDTQKSRSEQINATSSESVEIPTKDIQNHKEDTAIATVEAMTLAHKVALGQMNKYDLINEGINKHAFRDRENLPLWFLDDENKHSKIVKPITKEAAAAYRAQERQMNARPIKKVLEAQGRKKMRALKRLERLKKKSDVINEDSAKSEKDKADEIQRLMRKLTKKQSVKPKTTLVVARGSNRGLSGRPRGVKGKYKMVDGVMKNEQRALKRIAKKHKK